MCSGSEVGSYVRLIDFVYHSTVGLRVIKRRERLLCSLALRDSTTRLKHADKTDSDRGKRFKYAPESSEPLPLHSSHAIQPRLLFSLAPCNSSKLLKYAPNSVSILTIPSTVFPIATARASSTRQSRNPTAGSAEVRP